jgi:hypothetical protein
VKRVSLHGDRLQCPIGREEPAALEGAASGASERVEAGYELLAALPDEEAGPVIERIGERPHRVRVIGKEIRDHHCFIGLADRLPAQRTELPPTEMYGEEGRVAHRTPY